MPSPEQRIAALNAEINKTCTQSDKLHAEWARAEAAAHAAGQSPAQIRKLNDTFTSKRRTLQAAQQRCSAEIRRLQRGH